MYCKAKKNFGVIRNFLKFFGFQKSLSKLGPLTVEDFNSSWFWLLRGFPFTRVVYSKRVSVRNNLLHSVKSSKVRTCTTYWSLAVSHEKLFCSFLQKVHITPVLLSTNMKPYKSSQPRNAHWVEILSEGSFLFL